MFVFTSVTSVVRQQIGQNLSNMQAEEQKFDNWQVAFDHLFGSLGTCRFSDDVRLILEEALCLMSPAVDDCIRGNKPKRVRHLREHLFRLVNHVASLPCFPLDQDEKGQKLLSCNFLLSKLISLAVEVSLVSSDVTIHTRQRLVSTCLFKVQRGIDSALDICLNVRWIKATNVADYLKMCRRIIRGCVDRSSAPTFVKCVILCLHFSECLSVAEAEDLERELLNFKLSSSFVGQIEELLNVSLGSFSVSGTDVTIILQGLKERRAMLLGAWDMEMRRALADVQSTSAMGSVYSLHTEAYKKHKRQDKLKVHTACKKAEKMDLVKGKSRHSKKLDPFEKNLGHSKKVEMLDQVENISRHSKEEKLDRIKRKSRHSKKAEMLDSAKKKSKHTEEQKLDSIKKKSRHSKKAKLDPVPKISGLSENGEKLDLIEKKSRHSKKDEKLDPVTKKSRLPENEEKLDTSKKKLRHSKKVKKLDPVPKKLRHSKKEEKLDLVQKKSRLSENEEKLDLIEKKSRHSKKAVKLDPVPKKSGLSENEKKLDLIEKKSRHSKKAEKLYPVPKKSKLSENEENLDLSKKKSRHSKTAEKLDLVENKSKRLKMENLNPIEKKLGHSKQENLNLIEKKSRHFKEKKLDPIKKTLRRSKKAEKFDPFEKKSRHSRKLDPIEKKLRHSEKKTSLVEKLEQVLRSRKTSPQTLDQPERFDANLSETIPRKKILNDSGKAKRKNLSVLFAETVMLMEFNEDRHRETTFSPTEMAIVCINDQKSLSNSEKSSESKMSRASSEMSSPAFDQSESSEDYQLVAGRKESAVDAGKSTAEGRTVPQANIRCRELFSTITENVGCTLGELQLGQTEVPVTGSTESPVGRKMMSLQWTKGAQLKRRKSDSSSCGTKNKRSCREKKTKVVPIIFTHTPPSRRIQWLQTRLVIPGMTFERPSITKCITSDVESPSRLSKHKKVRGCLYKKPVDESSD